MGSLEHLFPKHWFRFYTISYKMNFWRFFTTCTPCCITVAAHRNPFWSPWGSKFAHSHYFVSLPWLCVAQWDCRSNGYRNSGCRNSGCRISGCRNSGCLPINMTAAHHSILTGPMLFLMPNQQYQKCSINKKSYKPDIEWIQALIGILCSVLYAFAVYKAISLHTCVLP